MEKKKSPVALRIISLILLIGWMGLIFYLSCQDSDTSSLLSGGLIEKILGFFVPSLKGEALAKAVEMLQFAVRKGAHFTIYAVLGILSFTAFVTYTAMPLALRSFISLLISSVYAGSDEYHQTFVSGRSGEIRDVLIDTAGALTGIILSLIIYKLYQAIKNRGGKKMKKKQYIELTENLTARLNAEKKSSDDLRKENGALTDELSRLRKRLLDLESEAYEKKSENTQADCEEGEVLPENDGLTATPDIAEKQPLQLSSGIACGAAVIGKIVLSSAEYCNRLTDAGAVSNAKELVNLILGRTEVAKAEILRLAQADLDPQECCSAMEREAKEAEDYFKSVMAQK